MTSGPLLSTGASARHVISFGTVLAAVGALGYVSVIIFGSDLSNRESFEAPVNLVGCIAATLGLMLAAVGMLHGGIPARPWITAVASAALFFAAANTWFFGTGILAVTGAVSNEQFDDVIATNGFLWMALPKMVLGLVGFVALGIHGWRSRTIPRIAGVFLVLGGFAFVVPPFPPGVILASIGLFIAARPAGS
ncbi:MAG TPA: hypothetical protein PJ994_04520 [Tepidiformaceae bacterium]|nr:hypothetical protein [Tepidiformaceae bacterium]HMO97015.1 hypothetical protein [Tepidiformaceae bacterium]